MRKLDKSVVLSTQYKEWEEQLETGKHPDYEQQSIKNKFYLDIAMNLLHIQGGVCAYTEISLCDPAKVSPANWHAGKYKTKAKAIKELCKGGALDHFNPILKANGNSWSWDNFFFIDTDANNWKRDKAVDNILKPDNPDYDEHKYLEYDADLHVFIANSDLPEDIQIRVEQMINILGINLVEYHRKKYLTEKFNELKFSGKPVSVFQFFTAFEMSEKALKNNLPQ